MSSITGYTVTTQEKLQTHTHHHAHIIVPMTGEFYIRYLNKECILKKGQLCFVPPDTSHDYRCDGLTATINIPAEMVKPEDLLYLTENWILTVDERLSPLILLIEQEVLDPKGASSSLRYLFYYLYDKFVERHISPSVRYLNEHFAQADLNIADLAAMEGYNVSYYTEWFRSHLGCTPSEYLYSLRISKAKEILTTTRYRITDVAQQVGYRNASSFTRAFRASEGMTSIEFRQKNRD